MNTQRPRGFTLVELLVVIAIIGILASIVMVSLGGAKQKARDSKRIADIKTIQLALSIYYNDNLFYPKNIYAPSNTSAVSDPANGLSPAYLPLVPKDPNAVSGVDCNSTGANDLPSCYHYNAFTTAASQICNTTNTPVLYHIGATFEDVSNSALGQDADANQTLSNIYTSATYYACATAPGFFHGNAAACSGTTAVSPDACYDLTP